MSNLVSTIDSVHAKVQKVFQQYEGYRAEIKDLKSQIAQQKADMKSLREALKALQQDNQDLKTANAMLGSNEHKRETKLKINSLIREIDQCIVELSE